MNTDNETMITKSRWTVNCETYYHDGDISSSMLDHFATKAEAVAEFRRCIRLARRDRDVKVVRFGDLDYGVKGKYSNRFYSIAREQITLPDYAW